MFSYNTVPTPPKCRLPTPPHTHEHTYLRWQQQAEYDDTPPPAIQLSACAQVCCTHTRTYGMAPGPPACTPLEPGSLWSLGSGTPGSATRTHTHTHIHYYCNRMEDADSSQWVAGRQSLIHPTPTPCLGSSDSGPGKGRCTSAQPYLGAPPHPYHLSAPNQARGLGHDPDSWVVHLRQRQAGLLLSSSQARAGQRRGGHMGTPEAQIRGLP